MTGRPCGFHPEIGDLIVGMMSSGMSLREVCRQLGTSPNVATVLRWVAMGDQPDADEALRIFRDQYARAMDARAHHIFDEMIEIAENSGGGVRVKTKQVRDALGCPLGPAEVTEIRGDVVDRDKLRIDTRKWVLARMNPKKYGDKVDHTSSDRSLTPAPAQIIIEGVDPSANSDTK